MKAILTVLVLLTANEIIGQTKKIESLPSRFTGRTSQWVVTHQVPEKFYGSYAAEGGGILELQKDGKGKFRYGAKKIAWDCDGLSDELFQIDWGFEVDDSGNLKEVAYQEGPRYIMWVQNDKNDDRIFGCLQRTENNTRHEKFTIQTTEEGIIISTNACKPYTKS